MGTCVMRRLALCLALAASALLPSLAEASVVAAISLSRQRADVSVNGVPAYSWPVSTARSGYVTPTGSWRPTRTARMWYSRKYDNSPMPYSVFFYGGYAVHGTGYVRSLGRPASHGCVRLHPAAAETFYRLVQQYGINNARIVITR